MKRKTPSDNRGEVGKSCNNKLAQPLPVINCFIDDQPKTFPGNQAHALHWLLIHGKDGLPCHGKHRALVANLGQAIKDMRLKGVSIFTDRSEPRNNRYVLLSNVAKLDFQGF